jgi:hypothetical protein
MKPIYIEFVGYGVAGDGDACILEPHVTEREALLVAKVMGATPYRVLVDKDGARHWVSMTGVEA